VSGGSSYWLFGEGFAFESLRIEASCRRLLSDRRQWLGWAIRPLPLRYGRCLKGFNEVESKLYRMIIVTGAGESKDRLHPGTLELVHRSNIRDFANVISRVMPQDSHCKRAEI